MRQELRLAKAEVRQEGAGGKKELMPCMEGLR